MSATTLYIDTASAVWGKELVASLPASVRLTDEVGEIILMDGEGDWPERLSWWIEKGHRRIILADPDVAAARTIEPLIVMAQKAACSIFIAETHADNPAVAPFKAALPTGMTAVTLTGHGTRSLPDMAVEQLRLARAVGLDGFAVEHSVISQGHLVAILKATQAGLPVALRLTLSRCSAGLGHHRLMAHAPTVSASLRVYNGATARPGDAFQISEEGAHCQPALYESAHRTVLRTILANSLATPSDLRQWQADAILALDMTGAE